MRKVLAMATVVLVLMASNFSIQTNADTTDELKDVRDQRKIIDEDLSEAESKIAAILAELEALKSEIERIEAERIEYQESADKTEDEIENTLDEISLLDEEMEELDRKMEERNEILKKRMSSIQKSGGAITYLEVIFGASSFSDFINRVSAVNKITNSDAALLEQQKEDNLKKQEKQMLVFDKLDDLNAFKAEQEEMNALMSQQLASSEKQKEELENKKQELDALTDKLEMESSELASLEGEVKQRIAEEKRQAEIAAEKEQRAAETAVTQAAFEKPKQPNDNKIKTAQKEETDKGKQKNSDNKTFTVTATAYTAKCDGCSGVTSTGIDLNNNPDAKVIAVDPSVIPLGSTVYVEGYGYATAEDTGGAIKGNKIDVFVPDKQAAAKWGIRTVKVTIVR
ncbi:3D domain-containing protein [Virgibacillus sp. YIM 98842]|uniref:PcsB-like coiled-coil domain-containing protein n=1 Tax=Virgibacillus sp. YIM 98842 TaxID=2663533 RepID=UPI0023E3B5DF|nr:3D domain-containing protein [Virgibacillus sp. YIM 98842]